MTAEGHNLSTVGYRGEEMLFLNILYMLCTPHTHPRAHTLLIIIGWDAWGMCPGKRKHCTAGLAEISLPRLLICPPTIFFPLVQSGVCVVPCLAGGDKTTSCVYLFTSRSQSGIVGAWPRDVLRRQCWLKQTWCEDSAQQQQQQPGFCQWPNHNRKWVLV